MVIYEARLDESQPNFVRLKNKLKLEVELEFYAARQNNKEHNFENKWGPMKNVGMENAVRSTHSSQAPMAIG